MGPCFLFAERKKIAPILSKTAVTKAVIDKEIISRALLSNLLLALKVKNSYYKFLR